MRFNLIDLPFDTHSLEPYISSETLEYHHGKHHAAYVNKLNTLIEGTTYESMDIASIITAAEGAVFNNAAQVFNHNFYFNGMRNEKSVPSCELLEALERDFGSMEAFQKEFTNSAATLFGSGWVWLSMDKAGKLLIEQLSNAENPLPTGHTPLLTCDVWEHAYYIDYRNNRAKYIEKWWELVNWNFVSENFKQ